jgi:hypothetical protein
MFAAAFNFMKAHVREEELYQALFVHACMPLALKIQLACEIKELPLLDLIKRADIIERRATSAATRSPAPTIKAIFGDDNEYDLEEAEFHPEWLATHPPVNTIRKKVACTPGVRVTGPW